MADQKRWFKVWTSLIVDMDALPNAVIGAWTRLGCRAALVGTNGGVTFQDWGHLARFWNVTVEDAHVVAQLLPSVSFEEGKSVNGTLTVTFKHWHKYQEDSTVAERVTRLRRKRRGEEIRREKTRREKNSPLNPPTGGSSDDLTITGPPDGPDPALVAQFRALREQIGRPVQRP